MTKSDGNMAKSPWLGILSCALRLAPLGDRGRDVPQGGKALSLWLYADHYVPAELEVKRFDPKPGDGGQGRLIEGVIHPGGEPVWTSDSDLAIRQFVSPADQTGRRVPLRGEIEGQRLAVWYWPKYTEVRQLVVPARGRHAGC